MCGIVGVIGGRPAAPLLLDALRRLEYRGYDSAGIATLVAGRIERRRAPGKLDRLAERLEAEPLGGVTGIGHTRWATHGVPNETNAHPHVSDGVALVHNGIIENFLELRAELMAHGHALRHPDRHRGGGPSGQLAGPAGSAAARGRRDGGPSPARRLRAGDPVRGPGRAAGRRPQGLPARHRLRRQRDVRGLRRPGAGAPDRAHPVPGGGRHRLSRPRGCGGDRRRRQTRRAADPPDGDERRPDRQGQPPPFHGKGDLRAASRPGRHAALLRRSRHAPDRPARPALRPRAGDRAWPPSPVARPPMPA